MEIFTKIAGILKEDSDMTLAIRKRTDGTLVVTVQTKNAKVTDEAAQIIPPFVLRGTPEELDAGFAEAVCQPLERTAGLQTSMAEYEAAQKEAAAKSRKAADEKKAADDKEKKRKEAQKKLLDKANEAKSAKKWKEAVAALKMALTGATEAEADAIRKDIAYCEDKDAPDLFGSDADDEALDLGIAEDADTEGTGGDMPDDDMPDDENDADEEAA